MEAFPFKSFYRTNHGGFIRSRMGARGGLFVGGPIMVAGLSGSTPVLYGWNEDAQAWGPVVSSIIPNSGYQIDAILNYNYASKQIIFGPFTNLSGDSIIRIASYKKDFSWEQFSYFTEFYPRKVIKIGIDLYAVDMIGDGFMTYSTSPWKYDGISWSKTTTVGYRWAFGNNSNACAFDGTIVTTGSESGWGSGACILKKDGSSWPVITPWFSPYLTWRGISCVEHLGSLYLNFNNVDAGRYETRRWKYDNDPYNNDQKISDWDSPIDIVKSISNMLSYNGLIIGINGNNLLYTDALSPWSTFATMNGAIYDMAVINGKLYVIGAFSTIDGQPFSKVAYHDGTWHSMGTYWSSRSPMQIIDGVCG